MIHDDIMISIKDHQSYYIHCIHHCFYITTVLDILPLLLHPLQKTNGSIPISGEGALRAPRLRVFREDGGRGTAGPEKMGQDGRQKLDQQYQHVGHTQISLIFNIQIGYKTVTLWLFSIAMEAMAHL